MPQHLRRAATSDADERQTSGLQSAGPGMNYVWDFAILGKYSHLFWLGLGWTIAYTIGTIVLGTLIGLIVGILRPRRWPVIDWLRPASLELFRSPPLLVQIISLYSPLPVHPGP